MDDPKETPLESLPVTPESTINPLDGPQGHESKENARRGSASHLAPYFFKRGQVANPHGRPPGKDIAGALCRRLFDENAEEIYELLGVALKRSLQRGDPSVFKGIADRAFGRLAQPVAVSGDPDKPIEIIFSAKRPDWIP